MLFNKSLDNGVTMTPKRRAAINLSWFFIRLLITLLNNNLPGEFLKIHFLGLKLPPAFELVREDVGLRNRDARWDKKVTT